MKTIEQIAAELQGYDPQALSADRVNEFLAQLVQPVTATEEVGVFDALDRVLAEDVVSPISVPPHDNSAMDGFAFDSARLQPGQPLKLRVAGTAFAGKAWAGTLQADQCLKIMTGAIMPAGLDTVVPLEFVKVDGDMVEIPPGVVAAGDNRRLLGEDLMAGQPALRQGQTPRPRRAGPDRQPGPAQGDGVPPPPRGLFLHRRRDPEPGRSPSAKARCTTATATPSSACSSAWAWR